MGKSLNTIIMIKNIVKNILGIINCHINGITKYGRNIYIGRFFHVSKNSGSIIKLGNNISISPNTTFLLVKPKAQITIEDNIRIAHHFQISCANEVIIKSNVNIAPFVFIADHNHKYEDPNIPIKDQGIQQQPNDKVMIDSDSWIGTKVTIVGNVHIGKHCVIGANSVVTKDIPDYSIAAGIPCKILKRYNFESKQWEKFQNSKS